MKSFNNFDDAIPNLNNDLFLFKQYKLNKNYTISTIDDIKKFQSKHKTNIFQYVDYTKSIRFFFNIKLNNTKDNIDNILNNILTILNFKTNDLIIIQHNDLLFTIIHKYIYIDNYDSLDFYLFKHNIYNILLIKDQFIDTIHNQNIILFDKYNLSESILNNTLNLQKINTSLNLNTSFISKSFLDPIDFQNHNTLFIKSSMGSGKSTAIFY